MQWSKHPLMSLFNALTLVFFLINRVHAIPADLTLPKRASTLSCNANDPVLTQIKNNFGSPLAFCTFWNAPDINRDDSPLSGLAAADITRVCKCVVATPTIVGPTATRAMATPTGTSNVVNLIAIEKAVASPLNFCKYWFRSKSARIRSPFVSLNVAAISSVCQTITATPNVLLNPTSTTISTTAKTTTTQKTTTSSSSSKTVQKSTTPTSGTTTTQRSTTQTTKTQSTTTSSGKTSPSSSSTSTFPTTFPGTESTATAVTLPPAATATLKAMAPPGVDLSSLENLTPAPQANLYFAGAPAGNSSAGSVAQLNVAFAYNSIVLDHTVYITSVSCSDSVITINFNDKSAFQHSEAEWQADPVVILVTSSDSCGANSTSTMFKTSSFTFDDTSLIAKAQGAIVELADVFNTLDIDFGTVTSPNTTTSAPSCGTMNGTDPDFPSAACGSNFDATLDSELGYYSGDDDDVQTVLASIAPTSSSSKIRRSLLGKIVGKVASVVTAPVKSIATTVAKAAAAVLPASVTNAVSSIANVASSAIKSAASLLPSLSYSKTLSLPIKVGPAQNDPSPWGNQYQFFSWSPSDKSAIASSQAALKSVSGQLNGVTNPTPGIQMYCVNCGINGQLTAVGSISASLTAGVTKCDVSLTGNLYAGVFVGVNAFAQYEKTIDKTILSQSLPSLSIPGIASLGPTISVQLQSTLQVHAEGQLLVGASMTWPSISADLNLLDKSKSYQSGFTPVLQNQFNAWGDVTVDASLALPVTLFFGVDILSGKYKEGVSLVDTPSVTASAAFQVSASYSTTGGQNSGVTSSNGCVGIKYGVELTNDLSMSLLNLDTYQLSHFDKTLASGCLGRAVASSSSSTPLLSAPSSTSSSSSPDSASTSTTAAGSSPSSSSTDGSSSDGSDSSGSDPNISSSSSTTPFSSPSTTSTSSSQAATSTLSSQTTIPTPLSQTTTPTSSSQTTTSPSGTSTSTVMASALACGAYYTTVDGRYWQVQCGFDWPGNDMQATPYSNMSSCIDACDDYGSTCLGVIWVQRGQEEPYCYLKSDISYSTPVPAGLSIYAASPVTYTPLGSCPGSNNSTFFDKAGNLYQIQCSEDYEGYDLGGLTGYTSLESCINYCDTDINCVGVSFAYNGTYKQPLCYPKYQMAGPPVNSTVFKYNVDSAIKMTQPTYQSLGSCPGVDGKTFYDQAGNYYQIYCAEDYSGFDIVEQDGTTTLESCINACDVQTGCVGVSFAHGGYYGDSPGCYLKNGMSTTPRNDSRLSYHVDSAFLVKGRNSAKKLRRALSSSSSSSTISSSRSMTSSTLSTTVSTTRSTTSSHSSTSIVTTTGSTTLSTTQRSTTSAGSTSTTAKSSSATSASSVSQASSSPSASASTNTTSDGTSLFIKDTTNRVQLIPGTDGNLYVSTDFSSNSSSAFLYDNSLVVGDYSGRFFVYYPDMMKAYGASRFRVAAWGSIPHTAVLITLTPFTVSGQTVLVAVDTLGNYFFPVVCAFDGAQQTKVFLVKDSTADLSFIAAQNLRFTMTGGVVTECNPLALTASGISAVA